MKKYFAVYGVLCAILFAGLAFTALSPPADFERDIDFVAINEIVKQSAMHWQAPSELDGIAFAYHFALLDGEGNVRYASREGLPGNLTDALRRGFAPVDVAAADGRALGKALVETAPSDTAPGETRGRGEIAQSDTSPGETAKSAMARVGTAASETAAGSGGGDAMRRFREGQRAHIATAFALMLALNAAFLLTLHYVLVKPFMQMEAFAHRIAAGRLDEPLPMDKRNLFGLFTQSFDIMRESLREARHNQAAAERAKKEWIASLSHDLKTPLTSIQIISELLRAGTSDAAAIDKLKTIEQKAGQIDRLMNDLMRSALEELGELAVSAESTDSAVLARIFGEADPLSRARIGPVPPCLIELDAVRFAQVAGNIIANSYKYADTPIDIEFALCDGQMRVDVSDYGPGVRAEEQELITAKFYRGEGAKAAHKEGEGLGLYIAKYIMGKMGGGLETLNRGDGFTARLWIRLSQ